MPSRLDQRAKRKRSGQEIELSAEVQPSPEVTSVSPRFGSIAGGAVDVTAATIAGPSAATRGDRFTCTACTVPKLKGKKLKVAVKRVRRAGCTLGKVSGKRTRSGRVIRQSPNPGKVLGRGARVNVRLGA